MQFVQLFGLEKLMSFKGENVALKIPKADKNGGQKLNYEMPQV